MRAWEFQMPKSDSMTVVSVMVIFSTFSSGTLSLLAITNFSLLLAKSEPKWNSDFPFGFSSRGGGLGSSGVWALVTVDMLAWRNQYLSLTQTNMDLAQNSTRMKQNYHVLSVSSPMAWRSVLGPPNYILHKDELHMLLCVVYSIFSA